MSTKLLVIDDDPHICEAIKLYLENEGYEVKTAGDGAEGVSMFKMYDPDLVLLDIMMPKKDGWQVCREIREGSSKPIIMLTAKGEVEDRIIGLELGADDYLVKPFSPRELVARSRALLRRQAALLGMELLKQGSRLSVLPCEEDAFTYIEHMAEELAKGSAAF